MLFLRRIRRLCAGLLWVGVAVFYFPSLKAATSETVWQYGGIAVGTVDGPNQLGSLLMPDILRFADGTYRMYFNRSQGPGRDAIELAESRDGGATWQLKGTVLSGRSDAMDPFYIIGGARVIALADGRYRMYFRASPAHEQGQPPLYKIYSAISSDGIQFSLETGVRLDIHPDDPKSPFTLAGHGAFYRTPDGKFAAVISADPIRVRPGPSDLFLCLSLDGLAWGNCRALYQGFHDPVVIWRDGRYHLYANHLQNGVYHGSSQDGVTWPEAANLTPLKFLDQNGKDVSAHVGDIGAVIAPDGELRLFSNWSREPRPGVVSTAIAYFRPK